MMNDKCVCVALPTWICARGGPHVGEKWWMWDDEIEKIVGTFQRREAVEDFSVVVSYDEIREKGYSLSAGQYFDIKIDYVDITEEEFRRRMDDFKKELAEQFAESHRLEEEIMRQLEGLKFNTNNE